MEAERLMMAAVLAGAAERYSLSLREVEVLALVAEGCTDEDIGDALYIATSTVKSHIKHILLKMTARSRAHAIAIATGFPLPNEPDRAIATAVAAA